MRRYLKLLYPVADIILPYDRVLTCFFYVLAMLFMFHLMLITPVNCAFNTANYSNYQSELGSFTTTVFKFSTEFQPGQK